MESVLTFFITSVIALVPMLVCAFVAASWSLDQSRRAEAFMWGLLLGPLGIVIVLYLFPKVTPGTRPSSGRTSRPSSKAAAGLVRW